MKTRDFATINTALNAVRNWARMVEPSAFPASLSTAVASLVAVRREPGLFRALDVCVELVDRGLLSGEDRRRVLEGLEELLAETDYQDWRHGGFRAATLTYVRANAVRTARALRRAGREEAIVSEWIQAGAADPAPEVRYVTDGHE